MRISRDDLKSFILNLSSYIANTGENVIPNFLSSLRTVVCDMEVELSVVDNLRDHVEMFLLDIDHASLDTSASHLSLLQGLTDMKTNLTDLHNTCGTPCVHAPGPAALPVVYNFSSMPNFNEVRDYLDRIQEIDLLNITLAANSSINNIVKNINLQTNTSSQAIINDINKIPSTIANILVPIKEFTNNSKSEISRATNSVKEAIFQIEPYVKYSEFGFFVFSSFLLSLTVLVFGLFFLLTFIFGCSGISDQNKRSPFSHFATYLIPAMNPVVCVVFPVLSVLSAVIYLFMIFWTLACQTIKDKSIFEKLLETNFRKYEKQYTLFFSWDIFNNLTLNNIISGCESNRALYSLLELQNIFNLTQHLNENFMNISTFHLSSQTLSDTMNVTDFGPISFHLNTIINATDPLNYTHIIQPMEFGINNLQLEAISDLMHSFVSNLSVSNYTSVFANEYSLYATQLRSYNNLYVKTINNSLIRFSESIQSLNSVVKATKNHAETALQISHGLLNLTSQQTVNATTSELESFIGHIFTSIYLFVQSSELKINSEVGKCQPLFDIFEVTTGFFCIYLLDSFIVLWLTILMMLTGFLLLMCFGFKLIKFFRRPSDLRLENMEENIKENFIKQKRKSLHVAEQQFMKGNLSAENFIIYKSKNMPLQL